MATLPFSQGGTYSTANGKQRYTDPGGAIWEQEEIDAGKPTYRTDWSKIQEAPAKTDSSVAVAERPGYAEEAKNAANALDIDFTVDEEEAAKEEVRKQKQIQIDAINKIYDEMLTEEQQTGTERMGRSKAIANRAGILESAMGSAQLTGTEKFNAQQQKLLQAEREAKIVAIEDKMNTRLDEKIKAERELAATNYDKYQDYLKGVKDEAKTDATNLAKSGITLEQLKNQTAPEGQKTYYNQLKEETGFDDFKFSLWYDSQTPDPTIVDTKYVSTADGKTKAITIKRGLDGKITADEQILDFVLPTEAVGWKSSFAPDGTLLMIPDSIDPSKPLDDQIKVYGSEGQFAKPETAGTIKSGNLVIPESAISTGQQKLDSSRGEDKYANTGIYLQMLSAWKEDGGLEQDFFTQYPPKNYLNPNDDSVPTYIKDKLKSSSERDL